MSTMNVEELKRILTTHAGADETVDLDGDILDRTFDDLGYDSLALMETTSIIENRYGVTIEEDMITELTTPRALLDVVNDRVRIA